MVDSVKEDLLPKTRSKLMKTEWNRIIEKIIMNFKGDISCSFSGS